MVINLIITTFRKRSHKAFGAGEELFIYHVSAYYWAFCCSSYIGPFMSMTTFKIFIILILDARKIMLREVEQCAQGHLFGVSYLFIHNNFLQK